MTGARRAGLAYVQATLPNSAEQAKSSRAQPIRVALSLALVIPRAPWSVAVSAETSRAAITRNGELGGTDYCLALTASAEAALERYGAAADHVMTVRQEMEKSTHKHAAGTVKESIETRSRT